MKCASVLAIIGATICVSSAPRAQSAGGPPPTWSVGLLGGVTIPAGVYGDVTSTGWSAGVLAGWMPPSFPVSMRADASFQRPGSKDLALGTATVSTHNTIVMATLDAVWIYPGDRTSIVRPYAIGGVGAYNMRFRNGCQALCSSFDSGTTTSTRFGLNAGGGLAIDVPGFGTFIEARWHNVFGVSPGAGVTKAARFVPVTIGIVFH